METVVTPQDIAFNQSVLPRSFSAPGQDEVLRWGVVDGLGLVFAFPGTENKVFDWIENFRFGKTFGYHAGFYQQMITVIGTIHDVIIKQNPTHVLFVGYSQGGAVAQIALDVARQNKMISIADSSCVVFAAPRCFGWFNGTTRHAYTLYEYGNDIVPRLPLWIMGYKKVGDVVHYGPKKSIFKWVLKDHLRYTSEKVR